MNNLCLTDEEFTLISNLVYEKCGIKLGKQKRTLLVGRLQKIVSQGGFESFKDYYHYVLRDTSGNALKILVDRISTNHTYFFRESDHFNFLSSTILPEIEAKLRKNRKNAIRIWSAGCSSGEEPYTLAMLLSNYFGSRISKMDIGILATDIAVSALERAVSGIYPPESMDRVPPLYRTKYFTMAPDGSGLVKENIKQMILFRRLNLIQPNYPLKGSFQVIFCRNVMIYFDKATQKAVVERFYRYTEPEGYLFIGHSETIDRSSGLYQYVRPSVHRKIQK